MQEHDTKEYDNILDYWKMQIHSLKQQDLKEICYADKKLQTFLKRNYLKIHIKVDSKSFSDMTAQQIWPNLCIHS